MMEAAKQRAENERLQSELKEQKRVEADKRREEETRTSVFELLGKEPFASADSLSADYYFYETDDGVGSEVDVLWTFRRDEEVFILTEKSIHSNIGWGGPKTESGDHTWIFASDTSRPLVTKNNYRGLAYSDGLPLNMEGFEASRWGKVLPLLEHMVASIDRKRMLVRANDLLDLYGVQETRDKRRYTYADITRLSVDDDHGDTWTLSRANDEDQGVYSIAYQSGHSSESWTLELESRNAHPRWYVDGKNRDANHRRLHVDHIGMFKSGFAVVESAVTPALFDIKDLT